MFSNTKSLNNLSFKQLKAKATIVLKDTEHVNHLFDIVKYLESCVTNKQPVAPCLLVVEQIFAKLLQQRKMVTDTAAMKVAGKTAENQQKDFFRNLYHEVLRLLFLCFNADDETDGIQAVVTTMKFLAYEGNYPIEANTENVSFPQNRLRSVLSKLLSSERSCKHLINRFKEYGSYLDVLYYSWKILPSLTLRGSKISDNYIQNYLDLVTALPISQGTVQQQQQQQQHKLRDHQNRLQSTSLQLLCTTSTGTEFDYVIIKKNLNKSWSCATNWQLTTANHKQMLMVLIEYVLPHLQKPILMTDFLMDSLDIGGQVSLLALQGVFVLCQQNNLAYPNIYEKLYSMFEPEIFHMKYKARLFYLADIFLSSTHLPENLVAAFAKRLARLSLVAPPQDIVIIIYFVENLLLRHPEMKRLLRPVSQSLLSNDPYIPDERNPTKSMAIESSLWEIILQQRHVMPTIDQIASDLICYRLPSTEWDLSKYLETNENDVFDQEIAKLSKFGLNFERSMGIPNKECWFHWNL